MNGYNVFSVDDPYFATIKDFWPKIHGLRMLSVQDQESLPICAACSMITLLYTNIEESCDMFHVKCSSKQLYDVFFDRFNDKEGFFLKLKACIRYAAEYGLLRDVVYPWKNTTPNTFRMPKPPVEIFRSEFIAIPMTCFVERLKHGPLLALFITTKQYLDWEKKGALGIFKYSSGEIKSIVKWMAGRERRTSLQLHTVTVVGHDTVDNDTVFVIQDSHGTSLNCGYKKFSSNVFEHTHECGYYVKKTECLMLTSANDDAYKKLDGFDCFSIDASSSEDERSDPDYFPTGRS